MRLSNKGPISPAPVLDGATQTVSHDLPISPHPHELIGSWRSQQLYIPPKSGTARLFGCNVVAPALQPQVRATQRVATMLSLGFFSAQA